MRREVPVALRVCVPTNDEAAAIKRLPAAASRVSSSARRVWPMPDSPAMSATPPRPCEGIVEPADEGGEFTFTANERI